MFKAIECPSCFRQLAAPQIDIWDLEAACKDCALNFSFQEQLPIEIRQKHEVIKLPKGIELLSTEEEFEIDVKWRDVCWKSIDGKRNYGILIAWFLTAVFSFVWGWLISGGLDTTPNGGIRIVLLCIWLTLFVYLPIANLLNSTKIVIKEGQLSLNHGPYPTFNMGKDIPVHQIEQIYIVKDYNFDLKVQTSVYGSRYLLTGLSTAQTAVFIEQEIEKYLQIEDVQMKGEWQG